MFKAWLSLSPASRFVVVASQTSASLSRLFFLLSRPVLFQTSPTTATVNRDDVRRAGTDYTEHKLRDDRVFLLLPLDCLRTTLNCSFVAQLGPVILGQCACILFTGVSKRRFRLRYYSLALVASSFSPFLLPLLLTSSLHPRATPLSVQRLADPLFPAGSARRLHQIYRFSRLDEGKLGDARGCLLRRCRIMRISCSGSERRLVLRCSCVDFPFPFMHRTLIVALFFPLLFPSAPSRLCCSPPLYRLQWPRPTSQPF
jgi:hypothetical protein